MRSLIAERVTDEIVLARASDLIAARPLIESVVSSVVGGRAFTGAFRSGVRDVHRALFARDESTVTLALADVGTMVAAALEVAQPSLARRIETTRRVEVVRRNVGSLNASVVRAADTIKLLAPLLLLVAVAVRRGAIWLSADRRRTVVQLGVGAAIGGLRAGRRVGRRAGGGRRPASTARMRARRSARCGTRSCATCARRRGSSPAAAPWWRPRPRR